MKIQKLNNLPVYNQVFKSHSKNIGNNNNVLYDIDSAEEAAALDSLDAPFFPQLLRKIKKAYNIIFPENVVKKAEDIKLQIDDLVENHKFQAVA